MHASGFPHMPDREDKPTKPTVEEGRGQDSAPADAQQPAKTPPSEVPAGILQQPPVAASSKAGPAVLGYLLIAAGSALLVSFLLFVLLFVRQEAGYRRTLDRLRESLAAVERSMAKMQVGTTTYVAVPTGEALRDYESLIRLASAAENRGDAAEAMRLYRKAIEKDPAHQFSGEAHYRLALCLLESGRPEEALAELRLMVSQFRGSPYYTRATVRLAKLLKERGDYEQARRLLYQVVASRDGLTPEDQPYVEQASFEIAACLEQQAEAIEASRRSSGEILDLAVTRGAQP